MRHPSHSRNPYPYRPAQSDSVKPGPENLIECVCRATNSSRMRSNTHSLHGGANMAPTGYMTEVFRCLSCRPSDRTTASVISKSPLAPKWPSKPGASHGAEGSLRHVQSDGAKSWICPRGSSAHTPSSPSLNETPNSISKRHGDSMSPPERSPIRVLRCLYADSPEARPSGIGRTS